VARATGESKSIDIGVRANCEVSSSDGGRLVFRFPDRKGYLTPGRSEFGHQSELVEYLANLLSVDVVGSGLRGTAVCVGKYTRQTASGDRMFAFGDPILDLITDAAGEVVIQGRRINLASLELASPRYRSGGLRSIDLKGHTEAIRSMQVARAALGEGDFTLVECSEDAVALASTNPSQLDFFRNGHHLRFKAWKKNLVFYWSMGAEVETWGHDFTRAQIVSEYLDTVVQQVCAVVKQDSDSDTNDDYLDEYEWGVNAPQPLRVVSNCTALWHGQQFGGQVTAGPSCFQI
jgi:hypothetical protein